MAQRIKNRHGTRLQAPWTLVKSLFGIGTWSVALQNLRAFHVASPDPLDSRQLLSSNGYWIASKRLGLTCCDTPTRFLAETPSCSGGVLTRRLELPRARHQLLELRLSLIARQRRLHSRRPPVFCVSSPASPLCCFPHISDIPSTYIPQSRDVDSQTCQASKVVRHRVETTIHVSIGRTNA